MLRNPKVMIPLAGGVILGGLALLRYFNKQDGGPPVVGEEEKKQEISEEVKDNTKRILLIGSGMMTPCFIEYLTRRKENRITIASNILIDAQKLAAWRPDQCEAVELDVSNE